MDMATGRTSEVILLLRRAVLLRDGAGLTDGQLLEDFINRREEAAIASLVRRHAPMVWGVCRRVLRNHHDAEDAFQATFLVLVRKAASVVPREMVANWLYGVAHQTALKARATAAKRKGRERPVAEMPEPAVAEQDRWHDLRPLLDEELSRLPEKYRAVVVLCDLEGKTRNETARQLGVPEGTVAGRLARARTMLAKRLARRGITLSGGALACVLSEKVVSAGVPTSLVSSTIRAAALVAAARAAASGAVSAKVAALTEGVLKAMTLNKMKARSAVLMLVALIGIGGGATTLLAGDEVGERKLQYQPPGITSGVRGLPEVTTRPAEVALDANGGRKDPYFYSPPDPSNVNHLWHLRTVGDYYMIESKLGELALDANGGKGNPYLRHSDPTNINLLWKLVKVDCHTMIVPKVGDGKLALDANGTQGKPYLREADATNINHLWELRKAGDDYMIIPLVRRPVVAPGAESLPRFKADTPGKAGGEMTRREIEKILKSAEEAGGDRMTTLDEIEKAVKEMRKQVKNKD
jgi:RNA polymerase sigma factor (sigma-70 family)